MKPYPLETFAVVGHPVSHSLSPAIHTAAFEYLGLSAKYLEPLDVAPEDAHDLVAMMKRFQFRQLAVTIPHKEVAFQTADSVSNVARKIGAANTLTRLADGNVFADNTDWVGVRDALLAKGSWENKSALVVGAGGAARGVIHALKELNMRVSITNRTRSRAAELMSAFDIEWGEVDDHFDLVMNVTPVGMRSATDPENIQHTPIDRQHLREGTTIFDTIPNPLETRLLKEAKENGCDTIDGMRMLVFQAIEQLRIWTAITDPAVSERILSEKEELAAVMRDAAVRKLGSSIQGPKITKW